MNRLKAQHQVSSAKPLVSSIGSMSELFYNWYLFEMYNYDPSDRFEREKIKKLSNDSVQLRCSNKDPQ